MQRREALRLLFTGALVPALSPEAFAMFRGAHPGQGYMLRTLDAHHNATVLSMTDLIIPETDTPGAKAVKVNEFIDLILTEWAHEDERANFLAGLANVDKQSNELFGKDFADASPAQQTVFLRSMDDAAMPEARRTGRGRGPEPPYDTELQGNFWLVFKGITLHGYYTSQVAFEKELKMQIIPGAFHGCSAVDSGVGKA